MKNGGIEMKYTPNPMKTDDTAICTLTTYQSETIAFTPTKNAPSEITEGALYQNRSLLSYSHPNFDTKLGCIFMSIKCRKCEENRQSENDYFSIQP